MSFVKFARRFHLSALKSEAKIITYNGGVPNASGLKGGFFGRENVVKEMQKVYQAGSEPVHLKTSRDRLMYKGLMYGASLGLVFTLAAFYKVAMPKKN